VASSPISLQQLEPLPADRQILEARGRVKQQLALHIAPQLARDSASREKRTPSAAETTTEL
jgi:hypothetical protein